MRKQTKIVDLNPKLVGERKVKLVIPHDWEIKEENGEIFLQDKRQKYPKTYEECCDVLFPHSIALGKVLTSGYNCEKLKKFGELLICRDAYWEFYGEQIGLNKPWEPDWNNLSTTHAYIKINKGCFTYSSRVLVFPTEEMRDAFYENFKDLINECKELL